MALSGTALAPGRARGLARVAVGPESWGARPDRHGEILVLSGAGWPMFEANHGVLGCVVEDRAAEPRPRLGIPAVGGLDTDLFFDGDTLTVDGHRGTVEIAGVAEVDVVTAFLEREDGRILLLRRSERVGSFRGAWAGVSGFLEDVSAFDQATREVVEETGIPSDDLHLVAEGVPVLAREGPRVYVVHPFRFRVRAPTVRLDWEHTESAWVDPREIDGRPTVPKLARAWAAVSEASSGGKANS